MKILFIADKFDDVARDDLSPFPGGAEQTDAAVIEASPYKIDKIKFSDLKVETLEKYDIHIIGNSKSISNAQSEKIAQLKRHIFFEHDMRICRYDGDFLRARKEPVHYYFHRCICPHLKLRKLYSSAMGVIFLTYKQLERNKKNPFFRYKKNFILGSSAMNLDFFKRVEEYKNEVEKIKKEGAAVFFSPHRAKGYERSLKYCKENGLKINLIKNVSPVEVLEIFKISKSFVFLPESIEGAGRMAIEARFFGCDVVVNENVGIAGEAWWNFSDKKALEVVKDTPYRFWRIVRDIKDLSGK